MLFLKHLEFISIIDFHCSACAPFETGESDSR